MASASDPPAHPALQPADRLILPPQHPPAAVETSIGPPHYPAECTHSHASVQPSLRARTGHANSDSFWVGTEAANSICIKGRQHPRKRARANGNGLTAHGRSRRSASKWKGSIRSGTLAKSTKFATVAGTG